MADGAGRDLTKLVLSNGASVEVSVEADLVTLWPQDSFAPFESASFTSKDAVEIATYILASLAADRLDSKALESFKARLKFVGTHP